MNKGQINLIATILTTLGLLGGGIYFLSGEFGKVNEVNTTQTTDIAVINKIVEDIPEIKKEIKYLNENLLKFMYSQGVKPVPREEISSVATSTPK